MARFEVAIACQWRGIDVVGVSKKWSKLVSTSCIFSNTVSESSDYRFIESLVLAVCLETVASGRHLFHIWAPARGCKEFETNSESLLVNRCVGISFGIVRWSETNEAIVVVVFVMKIPLLNFGYRLVIIGTN